MNNIRINRLMVSLVLADEACTDHMYDGLSKLGVRISEYIPQSKIIEYSIDIDSPVRNQILDITKSLLRPIVKESTHCYVFSNSDFGPPFVTNFKTTYCGPTNIGESGIPNSLVIKAVEWISTLIPARKRESVAGDLIHDFSCLLREGRPWYRIAGYFAKEFLYMLFALTIVSWKDLLADWIEGWIGKIF